MQNGRRLHISEWAGGLQYRGGLELIVSPRLCWFTRATKRCGHDRRVTLHLRMDALGEIDLGCNSPSGMPVDPDW